MRKLLLVLSLSVLTAGCGIIYKQPIYQGNLIEKTAADQLQVGMTKQDVQGLMGSPSIADSANPDRWDYTSTQRLDRLGHTSRKNLTLWFENDALTKWEGDYFAEQDPEIAKASVKQFGRNLAKEKDKKRRRGS